jgi:hypothetical protein
LDLSPEGQFKSSSKQVLQSTEYKKLNDNLSLKVKMFKSKQDAYNRYDLKFKQLDSINQAIATTTEKNKLSQLYQEKAAITKELSGVNLDTLKTDLYKAGKNVSKSAGNLENSLYLKAQNGLAPNDNDVNNFINANPTPSNMTPENYRKSVQDYLDGQYGIYKKLGDYYGSFRSTLDQTNPANISTFNMNGADPTN